VTDSPQRELTQSMHRSTGSYELVLSPLLLALLGLLIDHWLGTTPIITVICAVVGLGGAVTKLYIGYRTEMDEHLANASWTRPAPGSVPGSGARTRTEGRGDV
jgi:F0F1-type ATP synthase assembly protein I